MNVTLICAEDTKVNRNLFLSILDMRLDELDNSHRADLMESALKIVLDKPTWKERVEVLKVVWSEVHSSQEAKRRGMIKNE